MAIGFISRHFKCLWLLLWALPALAPAADITLVGTFGEKAAVIAIDRGTPKTVKVGQTFGGVTLISVEKERATIEVEGKRRVLQRGQTYSSEGGGGDRQSVTLLAAGGGHYWADGAINGGPIRFVVDTGATFIALPASDAQRLGIDYRKGQLGSTLTAAGPTPSWRVRLDTVRVGNIEMNNIEGMVIESGLPVALLGNSFLSRVEIKQDSGRMTLTRRY
jgi:aspartyl protease family protein